MLKQQFIKVFFMLVLVLFSVSLSNAQDAKTDDEIIITSVSMVADKPTNRIIFKGNVVAKRADVTMNSDKMEVTYGQQSDSQKIEKIHSIGNVKVIQKDNTITSKEAFYYEKDKKIIFVGNAQADDGRNIIKGTKITYFTETEVVEVENSQVFLKDSGKK